MFNAHFNWSEYCCSPLVLPSVMWASLNVSFNLLPGVFPASASFYPGISWPVWTLWLHLWCTSDLWCIPDTPHPGHSQRGAQYFHLYYLQFFLPSFLALANLFHLWSECFLQRQKHTQRTSPCTTCLDKRPVCFSLVLATIVEVCRQQPAICELFIQLEWDLSVGHLWVISTLTVCLINYSLAFTCRCATGDNDLWNSFLMKQHAGLYLRVPQLSADFAIIWKNGQNPPWQVLPIYVFLYLFIFCSICYRVGSKQCFIHATVWILNKKNFEFHTAGAAELWMAIRTCWGEKKENKEERLRGAWDQQTPREERESQNNKHGVGLTSSTKDNKSNVCTMFCTEEKRKSCFHEATHHIEVGEKGATSISLHMRSVWI